MLYHSLSIYVMFNVEYIYFRILNFILYIVVKDSSKWPVEEAFFNFLVGGPYANHQ